VVKRLFFHGTEMIKKRLLYHGHSDDQAKFTYCTMGTMLIEEDQERVTVPWAHC